ncbi:MAG: hypothetical protein RIG27_18615 [Coleofasciculus sp. F4-SAH-05]
MMILPYLFLNSSDWLFVICHWSFVIGHLSLVIGHLSLVICLWWKNYYTSLGAGLVTLG